MPGTGRDGRAKDCGAEEEILNKYNNKKLFSVDNCENINDKNIADMNKNNARTVKLENISSFAERLVEV